MRQQAGFSCSNRESEKQFLVTNSFFRNEFAQGVNEKALARELANRGYLLQDNQSNTKVTKRIHPPHGTGKPERWYVFTARILENERCNNVTAVTGL